MDAVLRAAAIYLALLFIFRVSGRRTLARVTTFDLVLLLIISESTQQALLGQDFSITMAILVHGIAPGVDVELAQDFRDMRLHRGLAHLQFVGDLLVKQALAQHSKNPQLLRRQPGQS